METIKFNREEYPAFQASGFAARFAFPFAEEVCQGIGIDVGCKKKEWAYPGAMYHADPEINNYHALHFPEEPRLNYVFSSHCLEHLDSWVEALDYWITRLTHEGHIFLYLPDFSQHYWRPWNNRKHKHVLTPYIIESYFKDHPSIRQCMVSEVDLNNSFIVIAQKR